MNITIRKLLPQIIAIESLLLVNFAFSQPIDVIEPGVIVETDTHNFWNTPILKATAQLSEGAISRLGSIAQSNADLFGFTIMASVDRATSKTPSINAVGVAMTMTESGGPMTVSSSHREGPVKNLGFISRMVLSANEQALEQILVLHADQKSVLIEAPTIMYHQGNNQEVIVRYLLLVDDSARLRIFVWKVLEQGHNGAAFHLREFPVGLHETRRFYVDGSKITLGIPSKHAFGLMGLPSGNELAITRRDVVDAAISAKPGSKELQLLFRHLSESY